MPCAVSFTASLIGLPGARQLQVEAVNDPLFCDFEFWTTSTSLQISNAATGVSSSYNPADGLHGPAPLVNFFSAWRISAPVSDLFLLATAGGISVQGAGPDKLQTFVVQPAIPYPINPPVATPVGAGPNDPPEGAGAPNTGCYVPNLLGVAPTSASGCQAPTSVG